ncbi:MAG: methionine-S-sulfoxide reductase [Parcubacteria group bacterium Gr01-1014_18]|nr:MAG: methionine-S-sulfoxide reductase [Parcubacteria group bacterium Greene0416_36]TSC80112.1 MAG: methionine-S-sulfoxide reductase [Parcubacteria group bacterium Gr01-1014_18]TSC98598.1 MAG: methionine-S-sulfoxide reductase [Parcubacteria group bacterium Greene1014_20]
MKIAAFGAGCFWGVEAEFRKMKGVAETAVGFMGGKVENPSYDRVCFGNTGHAEVVEVQYDPSVVSYEQLLAKFWNLHDPTQFHRQGPDVGSQYRSVIFYYSEDQRLAAEAFKSKLEQSKKWSRPVVTEIMPSAPFYRAEEYHQRYLEKTGRNVCH